MSTSQKVLEALAAYDLKSDGDGKYRANSPLRPGSNSRGFTLTINGPEHGAYFDHVSQETGSLYDLAQKMGIEIEAPGAPVADSKRAYKDIDDYAAAHGVTADVLRKAGWSEVVYQNRPALRFKTATGDRWRFLDSKKPHYKSPKGYTVSWYGLTASLMKKLVEAPYLIIANGEISTVVGRHYGLPVACVTGGEKGLTPALIQQLREFLGADEEAPPVVVAFDCDSTGRRAGRLVAKQLRDAGFIAKAVDLGLGDHGDLADFCMLHGKDAPKQIAQLPTLPDNENDDDQPGRRNWYIIPAADLKKLPPIEWIVEGEIPARGITVLFGPSGAGKSFIALDYALRIAQEQPVLYMASEGEYGYQQRVAAWVKHHNKTEGQLFMVIGAVQFLESADLEAFQNAISAIRPKLVIVDTLARSMLGSDENSTRDMGLFMQACEDIKRQQDTAILLVHHTNKGGVLERGSSALRGASDSMIKVYAQDDLVIIESAKTKDSKPFTTRYMQIVPVEVTINDEAAESAVMIEAEKVIQGPDDPLTQHQEKALRCLANETFGATRQEIAELTAIPYFSLQRVLGRLKELQYIDQSNKNEPYTITDAGRDRLERIDQQQRDSREDDRLDRIDRVDRQEKTSPENVASDHTDQVDQVDQPGENGDPLIDQQSLLAGVSGDNYYNAGM